MIQGDFLTVQYQNEKRLISQPEALSDEGHLRTTAPVGLLVFVIAVMNRRDQLKTQPVFDTDDENVML